MVTADKQPESVSAASRFGRWLRNGVLGFLIVLIGMCCYFVYRLSMVAYRMEQSIVAISSDVKQVSSTAATLSRDVSAIREDIAKLKQRGQESLPYEQARHAMDEALAVGVSIKADSSKLPAASEREIRALLKSLVLSPYSAKVGGTKHSIFTLYGWVYGRYRLMKNTLTSTEDFIERVGTKSILGKTYYLVDKEGKRIQLSDWLRDRLKEMRREGTWESRAKAQRKALDIEIRLPSDRPVSRSSRLLTVAARKNGRYNVSGKELSEQDLRTVIRRAVEEDPGQKVLVRSDPSVEFRHVAKAVAICRELGVLEANIGFDYKPVETQPRNQGTGPDQ